jgi:hypothetical protein
VAAEDAPRLAGGHVPEGDCRVLRGDRDVAAVGAERQAVAVQAAGRPQVADVLAVLGVPDLDHVTAQRRQQPAVGAERHAPDGLVVAAEGEQGAAAVGGVPDLDGVVPAGRGQPPPVRAEGHAVDDVVVAAENADRLAGAHVPEAHGPVV